MALTTLEKFEECYEMAKSIKDPIAMKEIALQIDIVQKGEKAKQAN